LVEKITQLHGTVYYSFSFLSFIARPYVVGSQLKIGFGPKKVSLIVMELGLFGIALDVIL
jgi:hypothetical protein